MLIILDIDYTIFDTIAFKKAMRAAVAKLGISEEVFQNTYQNVVNAITGQYNYDVEQHVRQMAKSTSSTQEELLSALSEVLDQASDFLYPDVVPMLKKLQSEGHTLVVFTWGNPEWQELKVQKSGLMEYLDDVFCTADEKHKIALSFSNPKSEWIFVNDHPREIVELHKNYPEARIVRMRREAAKEFSAEVERCYRLESGIQEEISSMSELVV